MLNDIRELLVTKERGAPYNRDRLGNIPKKGLKSMRRRAYTGARVHRIYRHLFVRI